MDIDPYFQSSDVPSTDTSYFFLDMATLHIRMVSMLSCRRLIQGTLIIFNLIHFNYACKMTSRLSFVVCHIFFVGRV